MWFARPSSSGSFIRNTSPVLPAHEKRLGSVPIGGGGESPLTLPALGYRNDSSPSPGSDQPPPSS
jgi:hypothetical protein